MEYYTSHDERKPLLAPSINPRRGDESLASTRSVSGPPNLGEKMFHKQQGRSLAKTDDRSFNIQFALNIFFYSEC